MKTNLKLYCLSVLSITFFTSIGMIAAASSNGTHTNTSKSQRQAKQRTIQTTAKTQSMTDTQKSSNPKQNKAGSGLTPMFGFGAYGDSELGFIADAKIASYIGDSQRNAAAVEVAGGPNIVRVNTTYGLGLTEKQRAKLTYEFLSEDLDFNFHYPDHRTSRWVQQNAIGGDYAYLFDHSYIESIGFGGYYTHSGSKRLAHDRRIAGADSGNMRADVSLRLWPYSRLTGGIDYDIVRYDKKADPDDRGDDVDGLGGHIQIEQRIFPSLKAGFRTQLQQTQYEYEGSLGWLMPSPRGLQLELVATTDYVDSSVTHRHFYTNGARLNASLNSDRGRVYSDLEQGQQKSLLDWTRQPSVRMTAVLAVTDQPPYTTCPPASQIRVVKTASGDTFAIGDGWTLRESSDGSAPPFSFDTATLNTATPSQAFCEYRSGDNFIGFIKSGFTEVLGDNWSGSNPSCSSPSKNPDDCRFR